MSPTARWLERLPLKPGFRGRNVKNFGDLIGMTLKTSNKELDTHFGSPLTPLSHGPSLQRITPVIAR
jgi:hypothetical protein